MFHAVTPATQTSCYYFFGMASLEPNGPEIFREPLRPVLEEDIFASEEIEKMIQLCGGSPSELMIKSDTGAVMARRMLQAMMDAEIEATVPA